MPSAFFRFNGELNDFLAPDLRERIIPYSVDDRPAVKHPIEALGVPHPEVAAIIVNRQAVGFDCRLQGGDVIQVHPLGRDPEGAGVLLRPPLPRPVCFLLDTHLGQPAAYLRMVGIDAAYSNSADDYDLAEQAASQQRVLLTRDRGLLKRKRVVYGYCIRTTEPRAQLVAVLRRYDLRGELALWRRCLRCNGVLAPVDKALIVERLEPKTRLYYDEFELCGACGRIYWQGSHHARMAEFIADVLAEVATAAEPSGASGGGVGS